MTTLKALGLTDGSAGMIAQVRSLAEALGVELELRTITVNPAWHRLPNRAFDWGFSALFPVTDDALPSLPELVISCGRKAALVAAFLRSVTREPRTTRFIHIQHPQMSPTNFDQVIAMAHDKLKGANVLSIPYALTNITQEKLSDARAQWQPKFGLLRKPWNAVLIGGSTNKYKLTDAAFEQLVSDVEQIEGALLVTTSRRTGAEYIAKLKARWRNNGRVYLYTGEGDNPYLGMLACADHVYVTNDSVNMMSEAKASGKPVSIIKLLGHRKRTKPARFAESLSSIQGSPQQMMQELVGLVRQMLAARP